MDFSQYPVTMLLIAANVVISLVGFSNRNFLEKGLMWPYYIKRDKQYLRFILSGFLHADYTHLFFNMLTLFFFGRNLEFIFNAAFTNGQVLYVLLYFLGMIAADLPSYIKHQNNAVYRSLGASGAVSAVVFGMIVFDPWGEMMIYFIRVSMLVYAVLYLIYCIYASKQGLGGNINHDAHMWGSIFGFVFTLALVLILRSDVVPYILEEAKRPSILGRKGLGEVLTYLLGR